MPFALALVVALQVPAPAPAPAPGPAPAPAAAADTVHLVIAATTDVHGRVLGWDYVRDTTAPGGLARAATLIEGLRAQNPDRVIVLDAGDLIQGNPFAAYFAKTERRRPHPIVDALNAIGYDAATPGNHELDFGVDVLLDAARDATYRYVSANITRGAGDTLLFPASTVVARGGVRVGVTGFTTPGVMRWDRAQVAGRVRVHAIAERADGALRQLEAQRADLKVVLIHSGLDGASTYDTSGVGAENVAAALAGANPKPDLVIVGHTHREIRDTVINGVHFVQPRNWALSLSVVHVWMVRRPSGGYRVAEIRAELLPLAAVAELPRLSRRVAQVHELVRGWAGEAIGTAGPGFLARYARAQDTPLLDFINEVQRRRTGADLSATASFDPAAGLPPGQVRLRDVAGVYPYENTLRAIRISGEQLRQYLEHATRYFLTYQQGRRILNDSVPGYNYDVVSGANYQIDLTQPVGRRIGGLSVKGRPVVPSDSFTLALSSYRQEGGGGYDMLRESHVSYDKGEDIRDLLVEEIRRAGNLDSAAWFTRNWSIIPPAAEAVRRAFAPAATGERQADTTFLRVLAIGDLHGALRERTWPWSQDRPVGGAAALKTWLDSLGAECGCTTVRLDAGDQMQGTLISNYAFGRPAIEVMNRLGIDAAAIGNHEFDWSIDTLRARMREARYQFVSANITNETATARPDWAEPWTIVSRDRVKVAVIGLTTRETPTATMPANVRGLVFGDLAGAVKAVLPQARAAADYVVVVAHEGAVCDSTSCRGAIIDLARQLDSGSVDLIVAGHSHWVMQQRVNGIPLVEAGSSGSTIAVVDFVRSGGRRNARVKLVTAYADQVRPDTSVAQYVARQWRAIDSVTSRPIARLRFALPREGSEYGLGRLIADAQRNIGRADVAIMNNSGIRTGLPAGQISYGQLYSVQPFGNRLVRLTVRGDVLLAALERVVADSVPEAHVAGVEVWYDPEKAAGRRIERTRLVNGRAIEAKRTYTLAVNNFMAAGGSGYTMLADAPQEDAGLDLDALVRYLTVLPQPVDAPAQPRLHAGKR
jgi:2',3'-cyclic-nucleotide 2'-phosphodiesterase (5'-nucleotidase family)